MRVIRTERCGLSLERAAKLVGWHGSKLCRTERGQRPVSIEEFATLITAWRFPSKERDQLLADLAQESSAGWWDRPIPGLVGGWSTLASFEADATEIVSVALVAVPGLLQIRETAIHIMVADGATAAEAEAVWKGRIRRQQVLGKVDYTVFITETALKSRWGGRDAHRKQLAHILRCQEVGTAGVRVIPEHQTDVLLLHSWLWMSFPHTAPVVHVELATGAGATYIHNAAKYTAMLGRLDQAALPRDGSRKVIGQLMESQ